MSSDSGSISALIALVLMAAILFVILAACWRIFEKAGLAGWKSLIPFYGSYCLAQIALGNGILFLLMFVPCANIIFQFYLYFKLAKAFGKETWFAVLTAIFTPIMCVIIAFSDSEYIGPQ